MSPATATVTLTLTIDPENNGDAFWPAFRAEIAKGIDGTLGRWPSLADLAGRANSVTLHLADIGEHAALEAALAGLEGWYAGDERAPHPLILDAQVVYPIADAMAWLDEYVTREEWEVLVGSQPREEFARISLDRGEEIAAAWRAYDPRVRLEAVLDAAGAVLSYSEPRPAYYRVVLAKGAKAPALPMGWSWTGATEDDVETGGTAEFADYAG